GEVALGSDLGPQSGQLLCRVFDVHTGVGDAGVFEEGFDVGLGGVDIEFCDGAALEVGQLGYGLAALYDAVRVGGHDTARAVEAAHEAGHRVVAVPAQPYVVGVGVLPVQRSEEEGEPVVHFDVAVGVVEPAVEAIGPGLVCTGVVGGVRQCLGQGERPAAAGGQDEYAHGAPSVRTSRNNAGHSKEGYNVPPHRVRRIAVPELLTS